MPDRMDDGTDAALEHARLRWDAETENARRLSNRENGILTVIAAILGLGLYKLGGKDLSLGGVASWAVRAPLIVSVIFMLSALYRVLIQRSAEAEDGRKKKSKRTPEGRRSREYASSYLRWPPDPGCHPAALESARKVNLQAYKLTTRAASQLHYRNLVRKKGIDRAQRRLFGAAIFAGLAMVSYILCSPVSPAEKKGAVETGGKHVQEVSDGAREGQGQAGGTPHDRSPDVQDNPLRAGSGDR